VSCPPTAHREQCPFAGTRSARYDGGRVALFTALVSLAPRTPRRGRATIRRYTHVAFNVITNDADAKNATTPGRPCGTRSDRSPKTNTTTAPAIHVIGAATRRATDESVRCSPLCTRPPRSRVDRDIGTPARLLDGSGRVRHQSQIARALGPTQNYVSIGDKPRWDRHTSRRRPVRAS
jgi:hypothetical protein